MGEKLVPSEVAIAAIQAIVSRAPTSDMAELERHLRTVEFQRAGATRRSAWAKRRAGRTTTEDLVAELRKERKARVRAQAAYAETKAAHAIVRAMQASQYLDEDLRLALKMTNVRGVSAEFIEATIAKCVRKRALDLDQLQSRARAAAG